MANIILPVRNDNMEYLEYKEETFPFGTWYDNYNDLADHRLPFHWHKSFEIAILLSGQIDYHVNVIRYTLHPNECIFINSNKLHYANCYKGTEDSVVFGTVFLPCILGYSPDSICYQKFITPVLQCSESAFKTDANTAEGKRISALMHEMEKLDPNNYSYEMQALSCLALIWADLTNTYFIHKIPKRSSASNKYEPEVKAMLSFIHTHYQNQITIKDLLQLTHISRSECFHSFKAFTNMSPIEYINEYRISKAADMLCHTSQNITEIFTSCGFCSSSYFGKLFKTKYGISPYQYRKYEKAKYQSFNH